jgi:hypothetical protein
MIEQSDRVAGVLAGRAAGPGGPALADPVATARVLRTISASFHDFAVVAAREAELRAELSRLPDTVVTVPSFADDIHDVAGLACIGEHLFGRG